jgi:hypothetical protein
MRSRWRTLRARVWRAVLERMPVPVHTNAVIIEMSIPELARAGILDTSGRRGFLDRVYQVYWWAVFVLVILLPIKADEVTFYFPAVVGVAAAWLFAVPAYAQSLVASADFSSLRPSPTLLSDFISRMKARPVKLPADLDNEAEVAAADALIAAELPALIPSVLLRIMATLSTRAVGAAIFGSIGLLAGPWLASIHLTWLRDWSPVSVLYAVTAPVLPLLFGSMLVPIVGFTYLASRRADLPRDVGHDPKQ